MLEVVSVHGYYSIECKSNKASLRTTRKSVEELKEWEELDFCYLMLLSERRNLVVYIFQYHSMLFLVI